MLNSTVLYEGVCVCVCVCVLEDKLCKNLGLKWIKEHSELCKGLGKI